MQRPLSSKSTRSNRLYMASDTWYMVTTFVLWIVLLTMRKDFTKS